jgi:hypothetical protein
VSNVYIGGQKRSRPPTLYNTLECSMHVTTSYAKIHCVWEGTRGSVVGSGTMLQIGFDSR